jgi:hypothetical protein
MTPIPDIVEVVNVADEPAVQPPVSPIAVPPADVMIQSPSTPRRPVAPIQLSSGRTPSPAPPKQSPAPSETSTGFVGRGSPLGAPATRTFKRRILADDDDKKQPAAPPSQQATVASTATKAQPVPVVAATPPRVESVASSPVRKSPAKKPVPVAAAAKAKPAPVKHAPVKSVRVAAAAPDNDSKKAASPKKPKSGDKSSKRRPLANYRVLVSHVTSDKWLTVLKSLGADVINGETIENLRVRSNDKLIACVHYMPNVPKASFKLLLALAVDAPIVSFDWIAACEAAGAYVDTAKFELPFDKVIDSHVPSRRPDAISTDLAGHRVELIGGTDSERKQLTLVLEYLDIKVVKGDNRELGSYKLTAAISFGGPRAAFRSEEMRAHRYNVVGVKWIKHCLIRGFVDPSDKLFAADDAPWTEAVDRADEAADDEAADDNDNNSRRKSESRRSSQRNKRKEPSPAKQEKPIAPEEKRASPVESRRSSQTIVHKPKRSRVIESQADDASVAPDGPPAMMVDEVEEEVDIIDDRDDDDNNNNNNNDNDKRNGDDDNDSIVNVVDDFDGDQLLDDIVVDELVPPTQRSTSRSLVVPSDSLTMSPPPPQAVRDTGEQSLAFDEIGLSQMPSAAGAPPSVVRASSRPMTPISSPPANAIHQRQHVPLRRQVEPIPSAAMLSSDDEDEPAPVTTSNLASVLGDRKYTAAMLPLAVHDREFEKEQRARDEDEWNGGSRRYPAATQYS